MMKVMEHLYSIPIVEDNNSEVAYLYSIVLDPTQIQAISLTRHYDDFFDEILITLKGGGTLFCYTQCEIETVFAKIYE